MNFSTKEYQNILQFINSSLCDSHKIQALLSSMFQFNHSLLWRADTAGNMYNLEFFNFDDQLILDYKEVHNANDVMHPKKLVSKLTSNKETVYRMEEITIPTDLAKSMYYQFIKTHRIIDQMVVYFVNGTFIYGGIGFIRFKGEMPFTQKDKEILQTLSIHLQYLVKNIMMTKEIEAKSLYINKEKDYKLGIIQASHEQGISFYNKVAQYIIKDIDPTSTVEEFFYNSIHPRIPDGLNESESPYYFHINNRKIKVMVQEKESALLCAYTIYLYDQGDEEERSAAHPQKELSNRELEIYHLVLKGYTNEQIAKQLWITINTVKKHLRNMYTKYNVTNRTSLIYKLEGIVD